jgi:hypothetical protein
LCLRACDIRFQEISCINVRRQKKLKPPDEK